MRLSAGSAMVLVFGFVSGCSVHVPTEHIVMFEHNGRPVDPSDTGWFGSWISGYEELSHEDFEEYTDNIIRGIRSFCSEEEKRRVLLFIHGGLNTQAGSIERAEKLSQQILCEARAYPVFVNWRSSLINSYQDHVFFVRQGSRSFGPRTDDGDVFWDTMHLLLSPFQLAGDLGRGILNFPIVTVHQLEGAAEWLRLGRTPGRESADRAIKLLTSDVAGHPLDSFPISDETDVKGTWVDSVESVVGGAWWVLMTPLRIVPTMLVDAGGRGAWEVMRRRVDLLFHPESDFDGTHEYHHSKGLLRFMEKLHDLQVEFAQDHANRCTQEGHADCGEELEITLVGHSMGTIVMNQIVGRTKLSRSEGEVMLPRFKNLTYLAAACSIAEYEDAAFPYLLQDPDARVYHVTLHPENENGQNVIIDITPRGSLLNWVDDFLAKPLTVRDRTAGSYSNLLPALHETPATLRSRIHVRVLPWADDGLPQKHSDFSGDQRKDFRFWSPDSWFPGASWSDQEDAMRTPLPGTSTQE